jgi:hypothetical protein
MMNPGGPVEEVGSTARTLIDALKTSPAALVSILLNICLLVFIFYALHEAGDFREKLLQNQYTIMRETQQLLAKCVVPDRTDAGNGSVQQTDLAPLPAPPHP